MAVKRENMIRRIIETRISQVMWYGLRFVRAVSRRGTVIKILLAFNIYRILG